ncbi:MAG: LysR substrate-binding domain-containing protein [Gammaproteobacteria bacterium]|nr:LysR substrate-binding domain-containing protein [Gammaproteobacteria bacterium]
MTLTELRYIIAVAQERHFRRAADRCFVSQPTLSAAIKKTEEELNIILFERDSREVVVTPIGEKIVQQAKRILAEVDALKDIASEGQDQFAQPVRLGAIYTIGPYLFPELIPALLEVAPQMALQIEENFTAQLRTRLRHNELDFAILALPFSEPGVITEPLYDEPFVVLLPVAHPLTQKDTLSADDLVGENILMLGAGHCFRDHVIAACPKCFTPHERHDRTTIEGSSLETIRYMVATGMGITVLPCSAAGSERFAQRLLTIRRFTSPAPARRVALAYRASFPRPQVIERVRQTLIRQMTSCVSPLT